MPTVAQYTDRARSYLNKALGAASDTFSSAAAQKRALDDLNRSYDAAREVYGELYRAELFANDEQHGRDNWDRAGFLERREVPFSLHLVKDHHLVLFAEYSAEAADMIKMAREARADIKATPVVKPDVKNANKEAEAKITRSVRAEMERLGKMYQEALDLGRLFKGLPVSANVHMVTNAHGTTFLRAFYYLNGKRTPLNVIMAAADTLSREEA